MDVRTGKLAHHNWHAKAMLYLDDLRHGAKHIEDNIQNRNYIKKYRSDMEELCSGLNGLISNLPERLKKLDLENIRLKEENQLNFEVYKEDMNLSYRKKKQEYEKKSDQIHQARLDNLRLEFSNKKTYLDNLVNEGNRKIISLTEENKTLKEGLDKLRLQLQVFQDHHSSIPSQEAARIHLENSNLKAENQRWKDIHRQMVLNFEAEKNGLEQSLAKANKLIGDFRSKVQGALLNEAFIAGGARTSGFFPI